jgi:hypothetical protein
MPAHKTIPGILRRVTIAISEPDYLRLRLIAGVSDRSCSEIGREAVTTYISERYEEASARALSLFEKRMGE